MDKEIEQARAKLAQIEQNGEYHKFAGKSLWILVKYNEDPEAKKQLFLEKLRKHS